MNNKLYHLQNNTTKQHTKRLFNFNKFVVNNTRFFLKYIR